MFRAFCLLHPSVYSNQMIFNLWLHESAHGYGDKLVENKDYNFFFKIMIDTMHKYFEVHW